jgi:hypothetical protein
MFRTPTAFAAARSTTNVGRFRPARRQLASAGFALLACWALVPATATAIEVVAIEEFWELNVGEPDAQRSAPQVTMVTSPGSVRQYAQIGLQSLPGRFVRNSGAA